MRRSLRRVLGIAAVALALPAFAGCSVESVDPSGNGTEVIAEGVRIENATIVGGDEGSGKAAFLGSVFNTSDEVDKIVSIKAGGVEASVKPGSAEIKPGEGVTIQTGSDVTADFSGFTANEGTYVPVVITLENAGETSFESLVVAPFGFYLKAAPEGTKERAATSASSDEGESHGGDSSAGGDESASGSGDGAPTEESDASRLEDSGQTGTE